MKLSTKGRYSTRAMLDLAVHFGEGSIQAKDIAERQQISARYLQQLFGPLRLHGLVKSIRGAEGGFVLAKPPAEIQLGDVIRAAEGSASLIECAHHPENCDQSDVCVTRQVWVELEKATSKMVDSISLQDLLDRHNNQKKKLESVYRG
ncbi:RrF2 family transcriptional regulator [Chloroflexota bacterium]